MLELLRSRNRQIGEAERAHSSEDTNQPGITVMLAVVTPGVPSRTLLYITFIQAWLECRSCLSGTVCSYLTMGKELQYE